MSPGRQTDQVCFGNVSVLTVIPIVPVGLAVDLPIAVYRFAPLMPAQPRHRICNMFVLGRPGCLQNFGEPRSTLVAQLFYARGDRSGAARLTPELRLLLRRPKPKVGHHFDLVGRTSLNQE